jgi:hypothetical protein
MELGERLLEHVEGQLLDQASALGEGHELVRRKLLARRVLPADERLDPDDLAVRE